MSRTSPLGGSLAVGGAYRLESGGSARLEPQKSTLEFVVNAEFAVETQGDGVALDVDAGQGRIVVVALTLPARRFLETATQPDFMGPAFVVAIDRS